MGYTKQEEISGLEYGIRQEQKEINDLKKDMKKREDPDIKDGIQGMIDTKKRLISAYQDRLNQLKPIKASGKR